MSKSSCRLNRRTFLRHSTMTGASLLGANLLPLSAHADDRLLVMTKSRPELPYGVASGNIMTDRVIFQDLADIKNLSEAVSGHFRTAPAHGHDILFQWSGDTAGQGWGINQDWGGMKIYEVMLKDLEGRTLYSRELEPVA